MKTKVKLPPMNVEVRETGLPHNVPPADMAEDVQAEQMAMAIQLNSDAKLYKVRNIFVNEVSEKLAPLAWQKTTLDIIKTSIEKHLGISVTDAQIKEAVKKVMGFDGFDQVAEFVQDDQITDFYNKAHRYVKKEGQQNRNNDDFMASNIGYTKEFLNNLEKSMDFTFNAKADFKYPRPLVYMKERWNLDLTPLANKIHPGHFTLPGGHGTNAFEVVGTLQNQYPGLDTNCLLYLTIAAVVFSIGRDGNLMHKEQDTFAGIYNVTADLDLSKLK